MQLISGFWLYMFKGYWGLDLSCLTTIEKDRCPRYRLWSPSPLPDHIADDWEDDECEAKQIPAPPMINSSIRLYPLPVSAWEIGNAMQWFSPCGGVEYLFIFGLYRDDWLDWWYKVAFNNALSRLTCYCLDILRVCWSFLGFSCEIRYELLTEIDRKWDLTMCHIIMNVCSSVSPLDMRFVIICNFASLKIVVDTFGWKSWLLCKCTSEFVWIPFNEKHCITFTILNIIAKELLADFYADRTQNWVFPSLRWVHTIIIIHAVVIL